MKKFHLLILPLVILLQSSFGQNQWKQFQSPEQVNDILEVENYLWYATNAGIIKLDKGSLNKTYFNQSNSPLTDDEITSLAKDTDGNLWATLANMTLAKMEGNNWTLFPLPNDYINTSPTPSLNDIEIDGDGMIWLASTPGVIKFDGTNWELFNASNTNSNYLGNVFNLATDQYNNIIAACVTNIMYNGIDWVDFYNDTSQLFTYDRAELFEHSNGSIWYHNTESSIGHWDGNFWKEYTLDSAYWHPHPPQEDFSNFFEDNNGDILLCTNEEGIYKLENEIWTKQSINYPELFKEYGKAFYYIDNQNVTWIANKNILLKEDNSNLHSNHFFEHKLDWNSIKFTTIDNDGKLYFINGNVGDISTYRDGIWEKLETPFDTFSFTIRPKEIEFTADNKMWVATNQGIFLKNQNGWTHFEPWSSYPANSATSIELDTEGNLWVASTFGLIKFDGTEWSVFTPDNSPLISDNVNYLKLDHEGGLWLKSQTTTERKWYRYQNDNWEVFDANFPAVLAGTWGEPFVDNDGNIWFKKHVEGVVKYDGTTWEEININNSNLIHDWVTSITQDNEDKMYFGTTEGISIFDGVNWENLSPEDTPLPKRKINSMTFHDGVLWAGSDAKGLFAYSAEGFVTSLENPIQENNLELSIFPNPSTDILNLKFSLEKTRSARFQILNINGKTLRNFNFGKKGKGEYIEQIDISSLSSGMYFLKGSFGSFKFIKF